MFPTLFISSYMQLLRPVLVGWVTSSSEEALQVFFKIPLTHYWLMALVKLIGLQFLGVVFLLGLGSTTIVAASLKFWKKAGD